MSCDVGEVMERLDNELCGKNVCICLMGSSPGELSEELVMKEKQKKG